LRLERLEENIGEKRCRTINKLPVYTGSSRTTLWRKNATRKDAAKGCTTLDAFIVRKVCTYPANGGSVSHFRQKRQRSPSPIDSDIEEVTAPVVCLEARAAAVRDDTLPASANNPTALQPEEALAQSKVDLAVPHWIKDTEVVLVQSAANLPACNPDASTNDTYEGLARSAVNLAMAHQNNSIDIAIDQLVDQLAVFCLDKVEQNTRDGDDDDMDISVEQLEEEYRVMMISG